MREETDEDICRKRLENNNCQWHTIAKAAMATLVNLVNL
jgi:hypothetical protein